MSRSSATQLLPHHGVITASVMVASTMQAVDTTIANVALPHIQGSLSATQEQMSWVITSYIVATAVMTPLSAWISNRIGRKRFLLMSIAAFTATSVCCGITQNLSEMVIFRLLQGLSGAALMPLSQAIMLDINPPERHGRAMALFVTGITIGPIIGAPLGAWLTEYLGWRWVFFINVPMGIACFLGLAGALPEAAISRRRFDFFGFATLSIATLSLQLMLDRGQLKDWFSSPEIWTEAIFAGLAAYLFIVHSCTAREPFINLRLFENRNYTVNCILGVVFGMLMLGPLVLLTSLLQGLLQYPVLLAGMVGVGRAIGMVGASAIIGRLMRVFDSRWLIAAGLALVAVAATWMSHFSLQMHHDIVFWSGALYGFGVGVASTPMTTLAFATLPTALRTEGSAFSNLLRNIGGSIGIALMQTLFVRSSFEMHARLAEHVTPYGREGVGQPDLSSTAALAAMDARVLEQAAMLAYNNMFKLMAMLAMCSIPLVLLFQKPRTREAASAPPPVEA